MIILKNCKEIKMKVAVTSKSFSKIIFLGERLLKVFPDSYFNDEGKKFSDEDLVSFLSPCQGAIIGLEKINQKVLTQLPNLKTISKYGVGMDNIDFEALKEHQVLWGYTPGTNKRGVAELALQMMLTLIRKSYQANIYLRDGTWNPLFGNNLSEKKVGILGLGNVGKELALLLTPFNCKLSCSEIKPDSDFIKAHNINLVAIEELFSTNDIVSIHIPLDSSTTQLINDKILSKMQKHAILINTSRGGIVDEKVLQQMLVADTIQSAGFDVFLDEPCSNEELLQLKNFYSTPHIGGSSLESIQAMGLAAINGLIKAQPITDETCR